MSERVFEQIRDLPRQHLEEFAIRAAMQMKRNRSEAGRSHYFTAIVTGFVLGALVAATGFMGGALLR